MTEQERDELRFLLDALCEETIRVDQVKRLEELVLRHPEAEAYYVQYMHLYADLSRAKLTSEPAQTQTAPAPSKRRRWLMWGAIVLGGVAAAVLAIIAFMPNRDKEWQPQVSREKESEKLDDTVAVLVQTHGAVWDKSDLPTRVGSPLRPGVLRLKSGAAQLEFYSGATVVLKGPAELELISRTKAFCRHGKLHATVPPQAQGFTISSAKMDLVDRGTEFGVSVEREGTMEVHVFDGKVELHDKAVKGNAPKELTTGQSVQLETAQQPKSIKQDPAAFVTAKEMANSALKDLNRRQESWVEISRTLRRDRDLVAYFTFQQDVPWERTLRDQAVLREKPSDGAIVGCTWSTGRWQGKHGLEFKQVSDRVRVNVPGEFQSITMLTWVRIDGLANVNNSLLMSDGWDPGTLHWQIGADGKLILGVQSQPKGKGGHYHALDAITSDRFGTWMQLGVVYDHDKRLVTHWLNGDKAAQVPIEFDIPLRIGSAELGNWNIDMHRNNTPIRFLTGCMDEFMIFNRALADAEITKLYEQGKPPN